MGDVLFLKLIADRSDDALIINYHEQTEKTYFFFSCYEDLITNLNVDWMFMNC